MKVWEIVAQSEPHVDVDPVEVGVLIRYGVFVFVILSCELFMTFLVTLNLMDESFVQ
jgi:hypothetical protein